MKSMTGFGTASGKGRDFKVEVHIKTLNSRFIDIKFFTPPFYLSVEPDFRKTIFKKCSRGFISVFIERFPKSPPSGVSLKWNKAQALKWKRLYQNLSADLKVKNNLDASHLIALDGVVQSLKYPPPLSLHEKKQVQFAFNKALDNCIRERVREGKALKADILIQSQKLASLLKSLKKLNHLQKKKSLSRRRDYENGDRMEKEKFDFNEELVRLEEHLKHFRKILGNRVPASSKKLEFYAQELLREFNTIGSKTSLSDSTLQVVEGKFAIEKIKEQVQNLE